MRRVEAWAHYGRHTTKLSDVARHLGFAGIALIWLLSGNGVQGRVEVATPYRGPLVWLAVGLAIDVLQYLYLSIVWFVYGQKFDHETWDPAKKVYDDARDDLHESRWLVDYASAGFVLAKTLLIGFGYALLLDAAARALY